MGRAQHVVERARERAPRPEPSAEARRSGVRQTQPDGTITVLEDWNRSDDGRQPSKPTPKPAPVVDRSPLRVTD